MYPSVFSVLAIYSSLIASTSCSQHSKTAQLLDNIKDNYTFMSPYSVTEDITEISITMAIYTIPKIDYMNGQISALGEVTLTWNDPQIKWDPINYGGKNYITLTSYDVWTPKVCILNQVDNLATIGKDMLGRESFEIYVNYTGDVEWYTYVVFKTTCLGDITDFPEDELACSFDLFPLHDSDEVRLLCQKENIYVLYTPSGEWSIVQSSCTNGTILKFNLNLKRKAVHFLLSTILPVILIGVINAFVFLIPPDSGERISFSVTMFLSLVVYLTMLSQQLPKTTDQVSHLSYYLIGNVIYSSCIIICTTMLAIVRKVKCNTLEENQEPKFKLYKIARKIYGPKRCFVTSYRMDGVAFVCFLLFHCVSSIVFFSS